MSEHRDVEHLDLDALADLLAGEGTGEAHLSGCPDCAARLGELADAEAPVAGSLRRLQAPPLPPELADRFAAAFAAEPPLAPSQPRPVSPADVVAGTGGGPASVPSAAAIPAAGTVTPLPSPSSRRTRRLRGHPAWLPSVAAGVVVVCGAAIGYSVVRDGGGSKESTTASSGASRSGLPSSDSGIDYADATAVRSALPSVLAGGARGGQAADSRAGAPPPVAPTTGSTAVPLGAAADPLAALRGPDGLASCLIALLPPDEPDVRPLALDYASYAGAPALAVVLPDPDPAKVSVYVVGPACTATADDLTFFTRLARP